MYQSCISEEAHKKMVKAIQDLIEKSPAPLERHVKMVLEFWETKTITPEDAKKDWLRTLDQKRSHHYYTLANLTQLESR